MAPDDGAHLLDLIRLRVMAIALKIDELLDSRPPEYVVTPAHPQSESELVEQ